MKFGDLSKKFKAQLHFSSAAMRFNPAMTIGFPLQLNLRLEAKKEGSPVPEVLQVPPTRWKSGLDMINFASFDVARFLSNLSGNIPDSIRLVGNVVVNPDYDTTSIGSVGRNSSFGGDLSLTVPLALSITDGIIADTVPIDDTTKVGSQGNRIDQKTLNAMNYGKLYVEIENGLPVQLAVKIMLLDRLRNTLLTVPQLDGDSVRVSPAVVQDGDVQSHVRTLAVIELRGPELKQFNPAQFVKYALAISTPVGQEVNFRSTDNVHVRIWGEFSYRVNQ